jgi:hypothetical protein
MPANAETQRLGVGVGLGQAKEQSHWVPAFAGMTSKYCDKVANGNAD